MINRNIKWNVALGFTWLIGIIIIVWASINFQEIKGNNLIGTSLILGGLIFFIMCWFIINQKRNNLSEVQNGK